MTNNNSYNFLFNPFEKLFNKLVPKEQAQREEESIRNSLSTSETDLYNILKGQQSGAGGVVSSQISFEQTFQNKSDKIRKFREMSDFPEINNALDIFCDEAIVKDEEGIITTLNILEEDDFPENIKQQIQDESKYLINNVFKIQKKGWSLFRRFLMEGEIYLEKIPTQNRDGISALKLIPPFRIFPFYESNVICGFIHGTVDPNHQYTTADIKFNPNQVAYTCWDDYINGDITDPKSYLYASMKTYNQLKNLEDSLILYRLSRAVEKRIFNVEVGQMPPGKAREFMNKLINQYKKNTGYDSTTGQINQTQNLMSFNEDYWFDQHDGKGSTVQTLQSGMNLGELRDVDYFKNKMYMTLKLPKSRWEDTSSMFSNGKDGTISREEIKFDQFVERVQNRFSDLFIDVLITHLKMKGVDDKYLDYAKFNYKFTKANYFAEFKKQELIENRLATLQNSSSLMYSQMNPQGIFASEYVLKKFFMMTDQEYEENEKLLEKNKKANPPMNSGGFGNDNQNNFGNNDENSFDNKPEFNDFNNDLSKNKDDEKYSKENIESDEKESKFPKKKNDGQIKENLEDGDVL